MRYNDIKEAQGEAERFLKRVDEYITVHKNTDQPYSSKEGGALKRASLDLTRALAKMRKSNYWTK